jgi:fimbrial isopeptide formation D2 family protein/LPXTG-motif cell wall-anchored protein
MKKIRKILSVVLMIVLTLSMSAVAFAAEPTGKITVADPQAGATYTAYKIFDAVKDDNGNVTYSIDADSAWYPVVSYFEGLEFTGTPADSPEKYIVTWHTGFSAANFADTLKDNLSGKTPETSLEELTYGYYLVTTEKDDELQERAALATVIDDVVVIQDKNDMPFDKTVDGVKEEDVEVGQTVHYEITSKVPDTAEYESYVYKVWDTMEEGLTFIPEVTVFVGDEQVDLTVIQNSELNPASDEIKYFDNGFELTLAMLDRGKRAAGSKVTIRYDAIINDAAVVRVSKNDAHLQYSNNPADETSFTVKDSDTEVYTSRILIDKFETGANEQKLSGAKFVLRKSDDQGNYLYYKRVDSTDQTTFRVEWVTDLLDSTEVVTDEYGAASFDGLADGEYELVETVAPAGYAQLAAAVPVTVDGSDATTVGLSAEKIAMELTEVVNISNTPGTLIPSTGGMGTTLFYIVGAVLVLGAGVVLVTRRRMTE